jgi:Spy/CpxP family protein refolding chaperone
MRHLLALVVFLTPAWAQPPRAYFPWWESPLAKELNLSDEQRQKIREIVRESRNQLIDKRAAAEKAEAELEDLFSEPVIDQARAQQAIDRLVAARSELTRAFTELSLKVRMVLTPEQWKDLQQRRSRWRPFGPGPQAPRPPEGRRPRLPRSPPGDGL